MVGLHGPHINLFIEPGPPLGGPVFEVTVKSVKEAKARLRKKGCRVVKDEPDFPRCYVKDPYGLIYNLTEWSGSSVRRDDVHWNIEIEREDDGRWIAEIVAVPGVIVYGVTEDEAKRKACALANAVTCSAGAGI
jgi:hypothetical protein